MRFRSTVKRFDNQQSSDTLHAKLSKGENGAICNITRLSLWHCSAFDTDRHFVEWRSLAGILISRRHYILFEKTNGCLFLSLRAKAPKFPLMKGKTLFDALSSSQERQYVWLAFFFFFFFKDTDLLSPFYFLWDCATLSAACSSARGDNYTARLEQDWGIVGH